MDRYVVGVCVNIEVDADNEEEARTLALKEVEPHMAYGWDYEIDWVYQLIIEGD